MVKQLAAWLNTGNSLRVTIYKAASSVFLNRSAITKYTDNRIKFTDLI